VPHLYADVRLSEGLLVGTLPVLEDTEVDDDSDYGDHPPSDSEDMLVDEEEDDAMMVDEAVDQPLRAIASFAHPRRYTSWPSMVSHVRKSAALASVRRLRVPYTAITAYDVASVLTRVQSVVFEPGASALTFCDIIMDSSPAFCVQTTSSHWGRSINTLNAMLGSRSPAKVVTLHGFDLRNRPPHIHRPLETPIRLWPRPTRSVWTETPWDDNVSDWDDFLAAMPPGKYELVLPPEPLTCDHAEEYAGAAFFLRILLRMALDNTDKDVSLPFGVQCACGESKDERWCSEPFLAALKSEGLDDPDLIDRMTARDARLPPPPSGSCVSLTCVLADSRNRISGTCQTWRPPRRSAARSSTPRRGAKSCARWWWTHARCSGRACERGAFASCTRFLSALSACVCTFTLF
jgi:hypothetical protein